MEKSYAALDENPPDQQPAVAVCRVLFAAEQGDTVRTDLIEKSGYALLKSRRLRQLAIKDMALIVVEFFPFGLAPDNVSEEEVLDSVRLKRLLDVFLVEMGSVTCVWTRPDIHNHLDFVLTQQINKFFDRVVRVPDCECRQFRHQ